MAEKKVELKEETPEEVKPVANKAEATEAAPVEVKPAEAAPVAAPAAPAQPAKKSNTALIVVIILLVIFLVLPTLTIGGIWWFAKRKLDKVTDDLNNGKVNVNLGGNQIGVNTTDNQTWPTTIPSTIPKFTAGKISASAKIGDMWTLTITGVSRANLTAYRTALTAAGWTVDEEIEMSGYLSWTATKGDLSVTPMLSLEESSMQLQISKQAPTTSE